MKCGVRKSWPTLFSICFYTLFPNLNNNNFKKSGWHLGEQKGHHYSVRYVIPEMELMSKYHTCFQENRQGLERLSPVGEETPAPLIFRIFRWGTRRWWTSSGQNFHRCEPWPAVFVQSWRMHIKCDLSMRRPIHPLPSCLLCSGLKRNPLLWLKKTKEQSSSVNNLSVQGTSQTFITAPLSFAICSSLWFIFCLLSRVQAPETSLNTGSFHCNAPVN